MDNFIGNIDAKVDNKGRIIIPVEFRKILQTEKDKRLILRKDIYEKCLVLYPVRVWEEELSSFRSKLKKYRKEARQAYRKFIQGVNLLEMDANGRILIPKRYLQMAGINADALLMGVEQTIEIWAPDCSTESEMGDDDFAQFMDGLEDDE